MVKVARCMERKHLHQQRTVAFFGCILHPIRQRLQYYLRLRPPIFIVFEGMVMMCLLPVQAPSTISTSLEALQSSPPPPILSNFPHRQRKNAKELHHLKNALGTIRPAYEAEASLMNTQSVCAVLLCLHSIATEHNGTQEAAHANIDDDRYDMVQLVSAGRPQLDISDQLRGCGIASEHAIRLHSANVLPQYRNRA